MNDITLEVYRQLQEQSKEQESDYLRQQFGEKDAMKPTAAAKEAQAILKSDNLIMEKENNRVQFTTKQIGKKTIDASTTIKRSAQELEDKEIGKENTNEIEGAEVGDDN